MRAAVLLVLLVALFSQPTANSAASARSAAAPPGVPARTGIWLAGDSITYGSQSSTGDGYRAPLMDRLNAASPAGSWYYTGSQQTGSRNLRHEGWPGYTIAQVAAKIPTSFGAVPGAGQPGNVAIWGAGTNDDGQGRSAQQMLDDTSAALDRIHLAGPDVRVLLMQITLTPYNTAAQQQAETDFDNGLPALAAAKGPWVQLVDMRGVSIGPDRVHPDDAGYADMAARIYAALQAAGWLPGTAVDKRISLQAHADWQYVSAANGGSQPLIANRLNVGTWERWQLVDLGGGDVALWSDYNGRYVTADQGGAAPLIANRTAVGAWERFGLVGNADGSVSLLARINGLYVTADQGGNQPLIANRTAVGPWEEFTIGAPL